MRESKFQFTVEFTGLDPFAQRAALSEILAAQPGVGAVTSDTMTQRCPIARLQVSVSFETGAIGRRLYNKLSKLISKQPELLLIGRECCLTDLYFDRDQS